MFSKVNYVSFLVQYLGNTSYYGESVSRRSQLEAKLKFLGQHGMTWKLD
jgi:hypothetical protein